jgi:hypothetical protein
MLAIGVGGIVKPAPRRVYSFMPGLWEPESSDTLVLLTGQVDGRNGVWTLPPGWSIRFEGPSFIIEPPVHRVSHIARLIG